MIDLWYFNTKNISQEYVKILLKLLPQEMINHIMQFRNYEDRRVKLFGRLIVKRYFEDKNNEFKWSNWHVANNGKPYYKNGVKFSISHSKDLVVVAFSDSEIGIDIEGITAFDARTISHYFHPKEAEYIEKYSNSHEIFFKLWTRKEAYLKAIGKGIIDGLNYENCLPDKLISKEVWYLRSLSFIRNYQMAICTPISDCKINSLELTLNEF